MNNMFAAMLAAASAKKADEDFTLLVNITSSNYQFGVTPYWNAGGYCNIDWGDGQSQSATTSGTQLTHTYAEAGSYRVKVRGNMYYFRAAATNPQAVINCNGNWSALGNLTNTDSMFSDCVNAEFNFATLPPNTTNLNYMFRGCKEATIPITSLPDGVTFSTYSFYRCAKARLHITKIPSNSIGFYATFAECTVAVIDIDAISDNAPAAWSATNMNSWCYQVAGCTGKIARLMRHLPKVTNVGRAFQNTNTTTFGDDDYFEITLTTTEANQSWGFTATSSAGRWYCFDWGDGTAVTNNKNLDVFTSGTKVSHTFATPGTYKIKLATAPCTIVFDAYDSDNGNWAALGLPADGLGGVFVKKGATTVSSAMTMESATITSGQIQHVYNHGSATNTLVESSGFQFVSQGGAALGTVLSGGTQTVYSGGTVNSTTVYSAGRLAAVGGNVTNVSLAGYFSFLTASNAYVSGVSNSNLAYIYAYSGGVIEGVTITTGGSMFVNPGGSGSGITISAGLLTVSSGGTALAVTSTGGTVNVVAGGYIEYA